MLRKIIYIVLVIPFAANSQQESRIKVLFHSALERQLLAHPVADTFSLLMAYDTTLDFQEYNTIKRELHSFIGSPREQRRNHKSELRFVRLVFQATHRKYLLTYEPYTAFNELFHSGEFNCLSGTAIFSYIFSQLGFETQIAETRYHSFLTIRNDKKEIFLIESTDPVTGVVYANRQVEERIHAYQRKENTIYTDSLAIPVNTYPGLKHIQLKELAGLHYFNLAVVSFNNTRYEEAIAHLRKARLLYPQSQRIADLLTLTSECSGWITQGQRTPNTISQIKNH